MGLTFLKNFTATTCESAIGNAVEMLNANTHHEGMLTNNWDKQNSAVTLLEKY